MLSLLPPFFRQEPLLRIGQETRGGSFHFPSLFLTIFNFFTTYFCGRAQIARRSFAGPKARNIAEVGESPAGRSFLLSVTDGTLRTAVKGASRGKTGSVTSRYWRCSLFVP